MKVRVFKRLDGGIDIFYPAIKSRKPTESEDEWYERVSTKANSLGLPYEDIDSSELPSTRKDRNVWELVNGKVEINQVKKQQLDDEKQVKIATKNSAISKLKILGLTNEEIELLFSA